MGFHGQETAHMPKITMRNAKRRLEWCTAGRHWTLGQLNHVLWSGVQQPLDSGAVDHVLWSGVQLAAIGLWGS
jgi:hypothetical protein